MKYPQHHKVVCTLATHLEHLQEIAMLHDGVCLAEVHDSSQIPVLWRCKLGHTWLSRPYDVEYRGGWCRKCFDINRSGTIEEMCQLAKEKKGECLSTKYVSSKNKLFWRCAKGHKWSAKPAHIKDGHWCPECKHVKKLTILEMQNMAASKGGKCLSTIYINNRTKLKWQCNKGHIWDADPSSIKDVKSWCPTCATKVSEIICRQYFEVIFGEKFYKVRPKWLTSPKGGRLELDGFCEKLKLAFEYNGQQHYDDTLKYVFKIRTFKEQQDADENKRRLCKAHDIVLIEIPHTVSHCLMGQYILEECKKNGVIIPDVDIQKIDYKEFDCYSSKELERIKKIALDKNGECLSKNYINNTTKMEFRCKQGHIWVATPGHIIQGQWCRKCSGCAKLSIEQMQALAFSKGGQCLSKEYINSKTPLEWLCAEKHIWRAVSSYVQQGHWCKICSKKLMGKKKAKMAGDAVATTN